MEAALKLKETAGVHAEALSAAELLHDPSLRPARRCQPSCSRRAMRPATRSARRPTGCVPEAPPVLRAGREGLPVLVDGDPAVELLGPLQAFYTASTGTARGRDPDAPPGLTKVTMTR